METKRNLAKLSTKTMNSIKGGNSKVTHYNKTILTHEGCGDEMIILYNDQNEWVGIVGVTKFECP
ncbi:MAG: hypothetical protein LBH22_07555 [Bacteroidales bacterium]|jgi:hypothetical protein|nr:hypothetical protein [Bacteroidales bacterium]